MLLLQFSCVLGFLHLDLLKLGVIVGDIRMSPVHMRLDVTLLTRVIVAVIALIPDTIVPVASVTLQRTFIPRDKLAVFAFPPDTLVDGSIVSGQTSSTLGFEVAERTNKSHVFRIKASIWIDVS